MTIPVVPTLTREQLEYLRDERKTRAIEAQPVIETALALHNEVDRLRTENKRIDSRRWRARKRAEQAEARIVAGLYILNHPLPEYTSSTHEADIRRALEGKPE